MSKPAALYESPFKSTILSGQVALITGGGSGIGLEITKQLGLHGAAVVIMGRRSTVLDSAIELLKQQNIKCSSIVGDVRSPIDAAAAVNECRKLYNRLDILINCAAGNFLVAAEDLSVKGFQTVMNIDTVGVFNMSTASFPLLKERKLANNNSTASIINISAILHMYATRYQAHASAAKAAIDSLTRSLALEWGEYGIRVNGIAPGTISDTAGLTKLSAGIDIDSVHLAQIPIGRLGLKLDIALGCIYLCSAAGSFINGDTIIIDGGNYLWKPSLADKDTIKSFSKNIEKQSRDTGLPQTTVKSKL